MLCQVDILDSVRIEPVRHSAAPRPAASIAVAQVVVDLNAIRQNFLTLCRIAPDAECAAVVKGDAYGHGMVAAADVLEKAGATTFFVAVPEDGQRLRRAGIAGRIAVLGGLFPQLADDYVRNRLTPVLNDRGQIECWAGMASAAGRKLDCFVHFDTGLNRLGLRTRDAAWIAERLDRIAALTVSCHMTHLSSADDLDLERCNDQRKRFFDLIAPLPHAARSIANSAASYFGREFTLGMYRPGKATFGINPIAGRANSLLQPAAVHAPVLQVEELGRGEPVGYSSTFRPVERTRMATVGIGYANGYPRAASNRAKVAVGGFLAPVVGRVSMDVITVDVSHVPERLVYPGAPIEITGPNVPVADLAHASGTIEHEVLINLGQGCSRSYIDSSGCNSATR
jgi:alanine racemase